MRGPPERPNLACGLATAVGTPISEVLRQVSPGLEADEYGRQHDDDKGHDRRNGRAVADLRLRKEVFVDVIRRDEGRRAGATPRQHKYLAEHFERGDRRNQHYDEYLGTYLGQGDMDECLPGGRAVERRSLRQGRIRPLQSSEEDDQREAHLEPDHHAHDRQERRPGVSQPVSYTHLRAHETVLDLVCRLLLEKK